MANDVEASQKQNSPTFKLTRADITSLIAVMVSLMALGVSVYEAGILKEQQQIMQEQKKASVWPYLKGDFSIIYRDTIKYSFSFVNKGIGPALVKEAKLTLQGEPIGDYMDLVNKLHQIFPDSIDFGISYGDPSDKVLSADEVYESIYLFFPRPKGSVDLIRKVDFKYEVEYCSIYGDCWTLGPDIGSPVPAE